MFAAKAGTHGMKRDRSPLPVRAQRIVDGQKALMLQVETRMIEVLQAVVCSNDMAHAKRLCLAASEGLEPGSTGWRFTSNLLACAQYHGFCEQCGRGVNGSVDCPGSFRDCPVDSGKMLYADVSAD